MGGGEFWGGFGAGSSRAELQAARLHVDQYKGRFQLGKRKPDQVEGSPLLTIC